MRRDRLRSAERRISWRRWIGRPLESWPDAVLHAAVCEAATAATAAAALADFPPELLDGLLGALREEVETAGAAGTHGE